MYKNEINALTGTFFFPFPKNYGMCVVYSTQDELVLHLHMQLITTCVDAVLFSLI